MIKWLVIYAIFNKYHKEGMPKDLNIEYFADAIRDLDPVALAHSCIDTMNSLFSEPGVQSFVSAVWDFGTKFLKTIFQYYNG